MENDLPEFNQSLVEDIVEIFKNVYQPALSLVCAVARKRTPSSIVIISEWRQRNLERGIFSKIQRTILCDALLKSSVEINAIDISHWLLSAFSITGKMKAIMLEVLCEADTKSQEKRQYLEIWNEEKSLMTFDFTTLDVHGAVYTDPLFGALSWSRQEDKVAYIAEKKRPKTAPFYEQKPRNASTNEKNKPLVGKQYMYEDDWGEQLSPKTQPVIVICDVRERNIKIIDGIPNDISPAQVIWDSSGKGVVGVGFYNKPRRLGLVACTNRSNCIFHLTLMGSYNVLSEEKMSVMSPQFSPDGNVLIWLQRSVGGPHQSSCALVKYEWNTKKITTLVDIVTKSIPTKNGKEFFGIYTARFPPRCWTSDSKFVSFSTCQRDRINSYVVNIDDGNIWDIGSSDEDDSTIILDISEDNFAICSKTSLTQPPVLASIYIPSAVDGSLDTLRWNCLKKPVLITDNIISKFVVRDLNTKKERCFAIYYGPKSERHRSIPLIMCPHGGPHSSKSNEYDPAFHFFTRLGFGVLIVNYRGSLGCGKDFVDALPGKIGSLDVQDCYAAIQNALAKFPWLDPENVLLFGGSHGGFLVIHLSSQYPDDFKAVVAKNPSTNIPVKMFTADIPDWNTVECGFTYTGIAEVMRNTDLWTKMVETSPMYNVKKVKTPTLLLLGKKDLRVPSSQGLSYYNALKEQNVPTRVFFYEGNHSLNTVPAEMDSIINTVLWFKTYMKR